MIVSAARSTRRKLPRNVAELHKRLGGIPLDRIRMSPPPGTATEVDLEQAHKPICELIDGVLVEKPMGTRESFLGMYIGSLITVFVREHDLGIVLGEAGFIRVDRNQVRAPNVTFIPWSSLPDGELPAESFWSVAPGLIVEVLSPSNTKAEIDRKLKELFSVGCKLAWIVDPDKKTVKVYTTATSFRELGVTDVLDGAKVLPGFKLALSELFGQLQKHKKAR